MSACNCNLSALSAGIILPALNSALTTCKVETLDNDIDQVIIKCTVEDVSTACPAQLRC